MTECNGLHGHIKVAPNDGTVYLPNKNCGGKAAVVVSEDNGLTWDVRPIPTSSAGDNDPSVGIGAGGRVYVGYTASDKSPRVAVSDDRGLTWHDDFNLALGVIAQFDEQRCFRRQSPVIIIERRSFFSQQIRRIREIRPERMKAEFSPELGIHIWRQPATAVNPGQLSEPITIPNFPGSTKSGSARRSLHERHDLS